MACHLGGFFQGTCFSAEDVQTVTNGQELSIAISNIQDNTPEAQNLVLDLQGDVFELDNAGFTAGPGVAEVAIIGDGTQVLTGSDFALLPLTRNTILYLHGVTLTSSGGNGVHCSGQELWLDDSRIVGNADYGIRASSRCSVYIRRSVLALDPSSQFDVVAIEPNIDLSGGEPSPLPPTLRIENSFLYAEDSVLGTRTIAVSTGVRATIVGSTVLGTVRFSSFPSGGDELQRLEVRNSIILSQIEPVDYDFAPIGSSSVDEFIARNNAFDNIPEFWETNASLGLPSFQFEENLDVGHIDHSWFQDVESFDFHLVDGHPFDGVAQPEPGDPDTDIDGDPRSGPGETEPAGADVP